MHAVVNGGPWNVDDHLLILKPWKENFSLYDENLFLVDFWVQIWGLPPDWYSERIGKKTSWDVEKCVCCSTETTMGYPEKIL